MKLVVGDGPVRGQSRNIQAVLDALEKAGVEIVQLTASRGAISAWPHPLLGAWRLQIVQLTAYVRASNLAFMIVVTPAMASCAPGERLAMVLSREPLLGDLWWDGVSEPNSSSASR